LRRLLVANPAARPGRCVSEAPAWMMFVTVTGPKRRRRDRDKTNLPS